MPAHIIDGKAIASTIREEIRAEVESLKEQYGGKVPGLGCIMVGSRRESKTYVNLKQKAAEECGFAKFNVELPEDVSQDELEKAIEDLNSNDECHGFIVQLPLPDHIDSNAALEKVSLQKDADALLPVNVGLLHCKGRTPLFVPCTPAGVVELLIRSGVQISGQRAVVLGRSNIVGAPVAALLMKHNATVTIVHSATRQADVEDYLSKADIVIAAMGVPDFVRGEWIKEGAAVIDVGTTPVDDPTKKAGYRLAGDVCFQEAVARAGFISPVPGGVGPMTIAMLLRNTLQSFKHKCGVV